jgi:predicted ferric reductase
MENTVVTSPFRPISAVGICGTMLALSMGALFDYPYIREQDLIGLVVPIVLYIAIPLIVVVVKREDFEDEPFKIAKIVVPFVMIALVFVYAFIENSLDATGDDIVYFIGAALSIAFGGMVVYQGVKEIKILTINLGLVTVFAQLLGIYANMGENNMFIFGVLLVVFGGAIIFVNWKMLSIKKSRQEQLNGGGTDA